MNLDLLTDYEIPYLHPLAVHFPFVLLLLAGLVGVAYAVRGTAIWRQILMGLAVLAAPAAWFALETGKALEEAVRGEPMVDLVVETHELAAKLTLTASVVLLLLTVGGTFWIRRKRARQVHRPDGMVLREPLPLRVVLALGALAAMICVVWTGHLGGLMVWGIPVG